MSFYPYLVAAHVAAVVIFVGTLFATNRLIGAASSRPLVEQAAALPLLLRLDHRVTTPAMLLSWTFGLSLAVWASWFPAAWLIAKLAIVLALSALHGIQSGRLRRGIRDGAPVSPIPGAGLGIVIAMLAVAVLAVVKPI